MYFLSLEDADILSELFSDDIEFDMLRSHTWVFSHDVHLDYMSAAISVRRQNEAYGEDWKSHPVQENRRSGTTMGVTRSDAK